ncbi:MAG: hydantoinase/oxoprolinase family protein [Halobacteriota archaeon]|uniref:hydantoinase/oxoprolinase family protein n=1 Tax=Natronomonas sp. TaxID=2184060 RepID=UPI0039761D1E
MTYRICVDVGGTFTDLYIRSDSGNADSFKTSTTPEDFTRGIIDSVEKVADSYDVTVRELLADTEQFVHGTTVSTNAIIEGTTQETALITTAGFRDILWLRPEIEKNTYEWRPFPDPFVARESTYGVTERTTAEGDIETKLDETQLQDIIEQIRDDDVTAVAVSLLWSHTNPAHEKRIGELLDDLAPDVHYALSHEVNPTIREHRRTSSTALDAAVYELVNSYLSRLSNELRSRGFEGDPLIITANGGVMGSEEVADRPIWTVDAGPTMLPVATRQLATNELHSNDVIALDMGGTSLDMCVVTDGSIPRSTDAVVGDHYMLGIDKVGIKSIGSGGGSIAWVDDGNLLRVGPESAGADPGPVCYRHGNESPTVTDAALVLGYLNPDYFLGGEMKLDRREAERAIRERIGSRLGLTALEAAYSIYGTTIQDMVNGIKTVTIEQGIDPRNYVLSGGGGALGTFVVELARQLQIDDIALPKDAGVVSSIGGLSSDIRRDFVSSVFTDSEHFDHDGVNGTLTELESDARDFFDRAGIKQAEQSLSFYADARYPQQMDELQIELPASRIRTDDEQRLVERFHDRHDSTFGYAMPEESVEFLKWRVDARGSTDGGESLSTPVSSMSDASGPALYSKREAYFGRSLLACPAYRSERLTTGRSIEGPAFIDDQNTTIVLPPDSEATITDAGNYLIRT